MIRPIPRHSQARQNLSYPKYGQFGFDEPVGRKHLRNKLSAIHKLIFNEEAEPITRGSYNDVKMNLKGSFLDYSPQKHGRLEQPTRNYGDSIAEYQNLRQNSPRTYERNEQNAKTNAKVNVDMSFNIIQNQYSEAFSPSSSRVQKREDSLDSILNPYKNRDLKRELSNQSSIQNSSFSEADIYKSRKSSADISRQLSQRYMIDSIDQHRPKNPTFLNSLL